MPAMTSVPSTRAINAMCRLLADYKAGADTRKALADVRRELGDAEYKLFERDLAAYMYRFSAWKAVSTIIGDAVRRKKTAMEGRGEPR